ncbi:MAG: O-antigen ligase family protein, partial [Candidatus Gastranaerophilales bacterium]|nr:O-antigen ligase family protein [Candidatus Gastranaerophilales bacterium]
QVNLKHHLINNIDNFYFLMLTCLIFTIPFVNSEVIGLLASVLFIISIIKSLFTHKLFNFSTIHIPIIIFLAIMFVSVGFSSLFIPSLKGFAKMTIYIGSFFSFFEFIKRKPNTIFTIVVMIAISCCVELLFSTKQMLFGVEELAGWQDKTALNPEDTLSRIFGTLKPFNPNLFAAYLLATAPCLFVCSLYYFIQRNKKLTILFSVFSLLSIITIIKTGCRGAYIGLFFSLIFFANLVFDKFKNYLKERKDIQKIIFLTIAGLAVLGILAVIFIPSISHRLTSIFTLRGDSSNSYRMNVYISSLKMFLDNFWIGIGPGNTTYRLIYGLYMVTGFDALGAYNIYLEIGVESGIFALLTFLWMIVLTFIKSLKKILELPLNIKLVIICCLTSIVAILFHGFFDTIFFRPQLQLLFWLYMAILAVVTRKEFSCEQ